MICPYCKKAIPDSSVFCPECGQTVTQNSKGSQNVDQFWDKVQRQNDKADQIKKAELAKEKARQSAKIRNTIWEIIAVCVIGLVIVYFTVIGPNMTYSIATKLFEEGNYLEAAEKFETIKTHKDSEEKVNLCRYSAAEELFSSGEFSVALDIYKEIDTYGDAVDKAKECTYLMGVQLYETEKYNEALELFQQIDTYKDSAEYAVNCLLTNCKYSWDFSNSLGEINGCESSVNGNTQIKEMPGGLAAAYFDGDGDYISCGTGINLTDDWSFHTVLCCKDIDKEYSAFFAKYETDHGGMYAFSVNEGYINCWFTDESGYSEYFDSEYRIANGEWVDISIVKNGDNIKLFINGELDSEENVGWQTSSNDLVTIGRQALMFEPYSDLQFTGYIAEISIFENALNEKAVKSLYYNSMFQDGLPKYAMANALSWNGHTYAVFSNTSSWEEAAEYCESIGGYLAVIESADENITLFNYVCNVADGNAYFGFSDSDEEDEWKWVRNSSSGYTNWHSGEPNGESSNEDYAMFYYMFDDGTWNDGDFGGSTVNGGTAYICEWDQ